MADNHDDEMKETGETPDRDSSFDEMLSRAEEDYQDELNTQEDKERLDEEETVEFHTGAGQSEADKARSLIDMSMLAKPHGSVIEGANGGEGTTVISAYQ